jgi:uncharacterized membrane protein YbhN (UPF0104 family)
VSELRTVLELPVKAELADDAGPPSRWRSRAVKYLLLAGKLIVTAACFWYVLRQLNAGDTFHALSAFNFGWIVFAVLVAIAQTPFMALRLQAIVQALEPRPAGLTWLGACALTAIYSMFAQVLPTLLGEGIRAWMLTQFGYGWRVGLTSVMLDRGAGVIVLSAFAFVILLLPSALTALAGYRGLVIFAFGAGLLAGGLALFLAPRLAPLLRRSRYLRWIGNLASDAHDALLGPAAARIFGTSCLIHLLTILAVWSVGRAEGLSLSIPDCAVLFVVMIGVVLVPVSIGGWGLREFAVVSLLASHGVAPERAFLFSLCFGLVFMATALPGAVVYLLYPLSTKGAVAGVAKSSS